jgi:MinD superfamily P-loop ATPase
MRQLVILSGKGGTGKTSIVGALAHLAWEASPQSPAVLVDADVDAANLELLLDPRREEEHPFTGGSKAEVDPLLCQGCGVCETACRFDAIGPARYGNSYGVDAIACDGCGACVFQCAERAIRLIPQIAGRWFRSQTRYGPLFHAELFPARDNSGKLVTLIRQQARLWALDHDLPTVVVDGPPGIGCPAISAVAGADLALIVVEPTLAAAYDMERALRTADHFGIPTVVCLNKADLYPQGARQIEGACADLGKDLIGRVPFDPAIPEAVGRGQPVTTWAGTAPASRALHELWQALVQRLGVAEEAR